MASSVRPRRLNACALRAAHGRLGALPTACLRTPAGTPVCLDATDHDPIWRLR